MALDLDGLFDAIVDVNTVSPYCKPMPESFGIAMQAAGETDPARCVMIDDLPRTTQAARQYGMYGDDAVMAAAARPALPATARRVPPPASGSTATGAGPVSGALGATLVFNGETAGCSLEPWIAVQWLVEPFFETGLAVQVPLLAGSWVLEPGVSAGPRWDADTGLLVRLTPGLAVTWYPGIPLTVDAKFGWTASLGMAGGWDSEWAGTLSLSGTLGVV